MVAYENLEGYAHGLLDFHESIKALFNLQVPVTKGLKMVLGGRGVFNLEEEINKWAQLWEDENN